MEILAKITSVLAEFGVKQVASVAGLTAGDGLNYLGGNFRAFGHFDFKADVLIYSKRLKVIGLVAFLPNSGSIEGELALALDAASYLRHLLVGALGGSHEFWRAPAVELVLVADRSTLQEVGNYLQRLVRESRMLHSVGVNILPSSTSDLEKADIGRAFCWLLRATQKFYGKGSDGARGQGHRRLALANFRQPGERSLVLPAEQRIHIVHGYNGTGKSSIAEAFELLMTGRIERLVSTKSYSEVLTHCPAGGSPGPCATLRLEGWPGVDSAGISHSVDKAFRKPLAPGLVANSFRLDQRLMDCLTSLDSATLAKTFLEAFFPEERSTFQKRADLERQALEILGRLPNELLRSIPNKEMRPVTLRMGKGRLAAVRAAKVGKLLPSLSWLMPLPVEMLVLLSGVTRGSARVKLDKLSSFGVRELAEWADSILLDARPIAEASQRTLRLALDGLRKVAAWRSTPTTDVSSDFATQLNRWLELSALVDLGTKNLQLAESLKEAAFQDWSFDGEAVGLIGSAPASDDALAGLRQKVKDWGREWNQLFAALGRGGENQPAKGSSGRTPRIRELTELEKRSLNQVGGWLVDGEKATELLGDAIAKAQLENSGGQWRKMGIGNQDSWAEPFREEITSLLDAFVALAKVGESVSALNRLDIAKSALKVIAELEAQDGVVEKTFLSKISPAAGNSMLPKDSQLNDALNELMALFTPARWAYGDVSVVFEPNRGQGEIGFTVGGGGAQALLRLNTAELNVFAVALFLLCAPRLTNPLKLLIFDDPLQNMDELTVATLARGLGRLLPVLPEAWTCIFLFHGEMALEIFRRELPAAVYKLDWLKPSQAASSDMVIEAIDRFDNEGEDPKEEFGFEWLEFRA